MIVYRLRADTEYVGLTGSHSQYEKKLQKVKGDAKPVAAKWTGMKYRVQTFENFHDPTEYTKAQSKALYARGFGDCVNADEATFGEKALPILAPFFLPKGEFLPVSVVGSKTRFYVYHCMNVCDAFDEAKSRLAYDVKDMPSIYEYVFKASGMKGFDAFRLAIDPIRCWLYVSDRVVRAVGEAGLTGFRFTEVWRSKDEPPPVKKSPVRPKKQTASMRRAERC